MTIVVADLVARLRQDGVQETAAAVKAVGTEAKQTAAALEIMAAQMARSKDFGGSATQALEMLQRSGARPTAAAMAEAAKAAEQTAAAVTAAVVPARAAATAAAEVEKGFNLSAQSALKMGAAFVGINVGVASAIGAVRLLGEAVAGIVGTQLDWERSLVNLSGLYGETGARAAALANAQANLPGVLGTQQEFARAAINASALTLRYGLSQQGTDQMITTGGRVAYATGMTDSADRAQLQAQILAAVTTGAPLPSQYGVYTDPEAVARRLGGAGAASLQAYTPQELMQARQAIVAGGLSAFADRAGENQRAALAAVTNAEKFQEQAQTGLQTNLENAGARNLNLSPTADLEYQQAYGDEQLRQRRAALDEEYQRSVGDLPGPPLAARSDNIQSTGALLQAPANVQGLVAADAERSVIQASQRYAVALADSAKVQEDARLTFERLSKTADAAGAHLLSFYGTLEDSSSIAHGAILAQAQGAILASFRSAVPVAGMGATEIGAIGTGTAYQQVFQNYVAQIAQQEDANPIQRFLQDRANTQGPGLEGQRAAAQRALDQAPAVAAIDRGMGAATTQGAQIDLAAAQTQADLERIALTQRERYVQLMRDTVDLRKLDVQQQQASLAATMDVVRAQQSALPAQQASSAAQYQTNLASALSQQRMARLLQGRSVADLPSMDQLINMNIQGQYAAAEAGPALVTGARRVEVASQTATAAGLAQSLTGGQIQNAQLGVDLKNLGDLPVQTALQLQQVDLGRSSLSVQTELREYLKQLISIMSARPPQPVPSDQGDRGPPASSALVGARRN